MASAQPLVADGSGSRAKVDCAWIQASSALRDATHGGDFGDMLLLPGTEW